MVDDTKLAGVNLTEERKREDSEVFRCCSGERGRKQNDIGGDKKWTKENGKTHLVNSAKEGKTLDLSLFLRQEGL